MASIPPDLKQILQETSRSFYLTMRILPSRIRTPIALGYLLARASDTIADTERLPLPERQKALQIFRDRLLGKSQSPLAWPASAAGDHSGETRLLQNLDRLFQLLEKWEDPIDQARIREVVDVITSGQLLDLERFHSATQGRVISLVTDAELEDYTYRVAGCVGEFWTKLCRAHLFPSHPLNELEFLEKSIQFGKGLQLVNILRDLPQDFQQGRCYLPQEVLSEAGLSAPRLLDSDQQGPFLEIYSRYLDRAHRYLLAGWEYTNLIPRGQIRLRLACAWPVLIGAQTLHRLRGGPGAAGKPVKITRRDVKQILFATVAWYPFRSRWEQLFWKHSHPGNSD